MAGDTLELVIAHPTVGKRSFGVKGDEPVVLDPGGFNSEITANGNNTITDKMNSVPWKLEGLMIKMDINNGDLEFIKNLCKSSVMSDITWQHIDGYIYSMKGKPVGEQKFNSNTGYLPSVLSGPGEPKKIA